MPRGRACTTTTEIPTLPSSLYPFSTRLERDLRLELRAVPPDVVVESARDLEEAVLPGIAVEPVEVRLRLDRSEAVAGLAMEAPSGLRLAWPPVESIPVDDEQGLHVAWHRHVDECVGGKRAVVV